MKITGIEALIYPMKLAEPYTIAYETVTQCSNVFIRVTTDCGITGVGCAAPDYEITNETADDVIRDVKEHVEPLLLHTNPFEYVRLLEELKAIRKEALSLRAMVDMVLFDIISKKAGVPLYKFLGGYRNAIATSVTIGILPTEETLQKAGSLLNQEFTILKLKGGKDLDEDIQKIALLRNKYGADFTLRFDANQGYSVDEAIRFVKATSAYQVEMLEQPTARKDILSLGKVSEKVPIPVMADESLMNLRDVFRLTRDDLTDMINIKLMKVGGIYEASQINAVARSAGVEAMMGCMDESALAISAGLSLALARPNIVYADLDGHLDLLDDPTQAVVRIDKGFLYPSDAPGLGLSTLTFFT